MNMTKIVLALALAMTALASVPASASPHHDWQVAGNCQEDLGYGAAAEPHHALPPSQHT
jgi:hypothetical protein